MGSILKLYREWQISGDDAFLRRLWPQAKRALEFAWTSWDADRDGVMEGEQHNTYDIEFYGPNAMMGTLYLGALKAATRMAEALGDDVAAKTYSSVFESGRKKLEELWNGEYYVQRVPAAAEIKAGPASLNEPWHAPAIVDGQVRYQYGDGLPLRPAPGRVVRRGGRARAPPSPRPRARHPRRRSTATTSGTTSSSTRTRSASTPSATRRACCSAPGRRAGARPCPSSTPTRCGRGSSTRWRPTSSTRATWPRAWPIVRGVRDRYDGRRRNPWNEVECGSHYARALSSWSLVLALSGFSFSAPERRLGFAPRVNATRLPLLLQRGRRAGGRSSSGSRSREPDARLDVRYGEVRLRRLDLRNEGGWGKAVRATLAIPEGREGRASVTLDGETLRVDLGREVRIGEGQSLAVSLRPA